MEKLWSQSLGLYSMEMMLFRQIIALLTVDILSAQILGLYRMEMDL